MYAMMYFQKFEADNIIMCSSNVFSNTLFTLLTPVTHVGEHYNYDRIVLLTNLKTYNKTYTYSNPKKVIQTIKVIQTRPYCSSFTFIL